MKKVLSMLLMVLALIGFAGCSSKNPGEVNTPSATPTPSEAKSPTEVSTPSETDIYASRDVNYPKELPNLGEDAIAIHYQRADNKYAKWGLWLWSNDAADDNVVDTFNYQDEYGVIAYYPLSKWTLTSGKLGFIIRELAAWNKDTEGDRYVVFSDYTKDANGIYHVYLVGKDENIYTNSDKVKLDKIKGCSFVSEAAVNVEASNPVSSVELYCNGELLVTASGRGRQTVRVDLPKTHEISFSNQYSVKVTFKNTGAILEEEVGIKGLFNTDLFNNNYYYDGELGAIYTAESTTFKVWSPLSTSIKLRVYQNGTPISVSATKGNDDYVEYDMTKGDKGVWSFTKVGNLEGQYYTYFVKNATYPQGKEIVDPYAKSSGINGLRGMVVDFSKTNPEGWDSVNYLNYDRTALTVYETHVADVTSSSTWGGNASYAKKFLGLIQTGTTYTSGSKTVTTGFDHIKELGVNAIQFIPIFDQANDEVNTSFNWGYNPLNYNVVEGCYSTNPYDGYTKINELKQVIMAYNKAGITTIMDVVYNHVSGANGSNMDVLMPGYYYRYNGATLSNGSGCGNELASENKMVRKFIIDSTSFWMEEYKLGGFRFDLMGLEDIETMNQVVAKLNTINPYNVVYGEPWTGGSSPLNSDLQAIQNNVSKFVGYGQFNDQMRDALIKGGLSSASDRGWITDTLVAKQTDVNNIIAGINGATGSKTLDPNKTVNYVTCHDNYTLYDRIKAAGITDEETIRKMAVLANSVVFTSKGTTFMLAGEEFLRTKGGDSNSYTSSYKVNELDYSLKIKNADVFENYKKLIEFKQNTSALHGNDVKITAQSYASNSIISYTIESDGYSYIVILANGVSGTYTFDTTGYEVYLDTLGKLTGSVNSVTPEAYQTVILRKAL